MLPFYSLKTGWIRRRCATTPVRFIWLLSLSLIIPATAGAQERVGLTPVRKPDAHPIHVGDLINAPGFLDEAIENTRRLNPDVYQRALAKMADEISDIQNDIGDEKSFYILNFVKQSSIGGGSPVAGWFDEVPARLLAIGEYSRIWVAIDQLDSNFVTQTEVDVILDALEGTTPSGSKDPGKGILEIMTEHFGLPPDVGANGVRGGGDGFTDFLLADIKDGWQPGQGYVAGFFYSLDQTVHQFSNRTDMLYVDSKPGIFNPVSGQRNPHSPLSVVAHEYQHLVYYNYKSSGSETWFNEGLSMYAERACGYPLRSPGLYFGNTNRSLTYWPPSGDPTVLEDYSRVALWTMYLAEQMGDDFIRRLVQLPGSNGISVINTAAQQVGSPLRFTALLQNWSVANFLNDRTVDPKFGYEYGIPGRPTLQFSFDDPNVSHSNINLQPYAIHYMEFSYGENLEITFQGPPSLSINALEFGSDFVQVVPVAPGVLYAQPEYGGLYRTIAFVVTNTSGGAANYGYSATGETSLFVEEFSYDDGTPKAFTGNAAYFGLGGAASEIGSGWSVGFEPLFPRNQLMAARLYVRFDNEFPGTSLPPGAPKSIRFHVWGNNNGRPGEDLIEPFILNVTRSDFPGDFHEIDLTDYRHQLQDLGERIYIGFTETDTIGTYVGMSNIVSSNQTYIYIGPNSTISPENRNTWFPMSTLSLTDGTQLAGWNMMMRARFALTDESVPMVTLGYLQNPLFSELLGIYAVGSTPLRLNTFEGGISQNGGSSNLSFKEIANSESKLFYDDSYTLSSEGEISIHIRARQKYGTAFADTTVQFMTRLFKREEPVTLVSSGNGFSLFVDRHALNEETYLTLFEGNPDIRRTVLDPPLEGVSALYTTGPVGVRLNTAAEISAIAVGLDDPGLYTLALLHEGEWRAIPSEFDRQSGRFTAQTRSLGMIGIVAKSVAGEPIESIPVTYALSQNYPNPFNPTTAIEFSLPAESRVTLQIFDMLGREVRTLLSETRQGGVHRIEWDGRNNFGSSVASGVYIYRMSAGGFSDIKRMVLIR